MNCNTRPRGLALSLMVAAVAAANTSLAGAQSGAPQSGAMQPGTLEEVVITGSFIKRKSQSDYASPLSTVGREDMDAMGVMTLSDIVNTLPENNGAQVYSDSFEQARSAGTTNINLRGLGVTSTLVLLNGRRQTMTPAVTENGEQFVDLNTLVPMIAVERVEVLKDGASSLYGSDAVAGVVNFITRSDFEGFEYQLGYQDNKADSDELNAGLIFGAHGERSRVMLAMNYLERDALPNSAMRDDYAAKQDSWSGYSMPSKVLAFDGPPGPPIRLIDPACLDGSAYAEFPGLVRRKPDADVPSDGSCQLNYGYFGDIIAEAQQTQVFAQADFDMNDTITLFSELGYARSETLIHSTPSQPQLSAVRVPAHHPDAIAIGGGDPFAGSASNSGVWFGRPLGAGSPANEDDKRYEGFRAQLGARGDAGAWSWEAAWTYSRNTATNSRLDIITDNLQRALNGQGGSTGDQYYHWLFSAQGLNTPDMYQYIFGEFGYTAEADQSVFDAHVSGDLFQLGGRTVGAAVGVQYRKDGLSYDFNERSEELAFNFFGGGEDFSGSQQVYAAFAELALPLADTLELQAAIRYEDFDSADTTNPKLALLWTPSQDWSLRASWGTSFRIATVFQQQSEFITPQTANDPLAGGEEVTFISLLTGDPAQPLKPQEADAWNAGVTWSPGDFTASLDYWRFDYQDYITPEAPAALLSSNPSSAQIERGPDGNAVKITTYYRNAGSVETDGVDFSLAYLADLGGLGTLRPSLQGTWILNYDLDDPILGAIDGLGNVNDENFGDSNVQLRANLGLQWLLGRHSAHGYLRYIGEYENDNEDNATVDDWARLDLQYAYQLEGLFGGREATTFTAGVLNALDEAAPQVRNSVGYDATVHDPRGRMFYVSVSQRF
ncbi:TonB-dependent receptor [Parahaliea mediterranea]|uniref:TonB-dependent receptor n=1 Tax=Parahaliea mediterranea TaxID=651086 RepID=UPI000E2F9569|nr:TonB-dependent receptor [Parahaliea mediterranea]